MAQTNPEQTTGFSFSSLLLPVLLAVFIFMMFRKQKKTQKTVQEQRTQMVPGTEVMTQFGLFGTIVSINAEENKAVLELSPGNTATVHMQALTKVVTSEPAADESPVVPDDASSITAADRTDAAPAGETVRRDESAAHADETPEETLDRLNRENKKEN
ncbi:preprotein translocase subunit YajC [Arthrobacter sp. zg-Y820]|uniref:preprotein translocase subunit YajC n=1 Tax=unclassified Arthrobacter TaxID=235627 RepID=UPI001E2C685F|nr:MULTISPECIES: preprotein translocase subunit YajC [unclassified Arthrobacter]MCC9196398.1 preprotein translocase subunit YajC [Arthrobacter sp. zg-Y820]MDK1279260.1 preprotein translocase subunit YajC [Arthrobacter sp. zg.Y820]MDK1359123.1 preprotein translocase subunit YajC [Arthrobacter sp. zg-Y1219]WIB11151.1 preprotein translocase subunit YajC [Arthrobacter sp. zg-Y820]